LTELKSKETANFVIGIGRNMGDGSGTGLVYQYQFLISLVQAAD
jgi:hypothetical protein